ncbi:MAG: TIGR03619 family F420-dependent LLM class oxidoreductase [Acidimicrobiia bacterium]|nr:TIGR03619 family F420-dependent LLM class oxidoreductase [Acidimicrobiia bacterium]
MRSKPPAVPQVSVTLRTFAEAGQGSWSTLLDAAEMIERAGVDRLVVSDHVAFGEALDDYARPELGGRVGGTQPTGSDGEWLEPLTVLSAVAARTTRIRLGTSILQAALRRPVVLAKTVATLDVLSGGRVDLGVGVGWQRAEYDAAGLGFEERGRLLDECLATCRSLWTEPVLDLPTGPVHQMPKPLQAGGVPVWVSGRSTNRRVVERVVRFGSGWIPWGDDADDPAPGIARLRAALAAAGRSGDQLQVTATMPDDPDRFADLVAAGVTDVRLRGVAADEARLAEQVERVRQWSLRSPRTR